VSSGVVRDVSDCVSGIPKGEQRRKGGIEEVLAPREPSSD